MTPVEFLDSFGTYLWVIIFSTVGLIIFGKILKYKLTFANKREVLHRRAMSQKPNEEMKAYIENPEQTIEALMKQKEIFKDQPEKLQSIDSQIKMLAQVVKIPPMFRPTLMKIGEKVMKRAEGAFDI